jgi:hypothetical protein
MAGNLPKQPRAAGQRLETWLESNPDVVALAFWQFNTREQHVQGFSYMNERESFEAGRYRFTLLALSRDSSAAVYLIEPGR